MSTAARLFLTDSQSARRARILEATLQLIGEVGAERMTMRDIAAASKVSAATLYNRFGTKDNLITLAVVGQFERSIEAVIATNASGKTPLQKITYGLELLAKDILQSQRFAHALISAYFKIDNDRQMPDHLLAAVRNTWLPAIDEMRRSRSLREWAAVPVVVNEVSDRTFAVVMRWAQDAFPKHELGRQLIFSIVTFLLGASRGKQCDEAEQILSSLSGAVKKRAVPRTVAAR